MRKYTEVVTFRTTKWQIAQLKKYCKLYGSSLGKVIRGILTREGFINIKEKKK